MKYIILNKSKSKSIIFFHGFYSSAGFWLPYLSFFIDYKLILFNIDYNVIIKSEFSFSKFLEFIEKYISSINPSAIISHSLGTIISTKISLISVVPVFEICPVEKANRINTVKFIDDIHKSLGVTKTKIENRIQLLDSFLINLKPTSIYNHIQYIPTSDGIFQYQENTKNCIIFEGDHFNISNAIKDIVFNMEKIQKQ